MRNAGSIFRRMRDAEDSMIAAVMPATVNDQHVPAPPRPVPVLKATLADYINAHRVCEVNRD